VAATPRCPIDAWQIGQKGNEMAAIGNWPQSGGSWLFGAVNWDFGVGPHRVQVQAAHVYTYSIVWAFFRFHVFFNALLFWARSPLHWAHYNVYPEFCHKPSCVQNYLRSGDRRVCVMRTASGLAKMTTN